MKRLIALLILSLAILTIGCRQLIEIPPPKTLVTLQKLSENKSLLESALLNTYRTFDFESGSTHYFGLYTDELQSASTTLSSVPEFLASSLNAQLNSGNYTIWKALYSVVYQANIVMETSQNSSALNTQQRNSFIAEARLLRAFAFFYLVNIWGDVPLTLSSDLQQTASSQRTASDLVYLQIIDDLEAARTGLPSLAQTGNTKTRASLEAATALLARVYLYRRDWAKAEIMASEVLESGLFTTAGRLPEDMNVFNVESKEAIFQLWNVNSYSPIGLTLVPASLTSVPSYYMAPQLIKLFTDKDARKLKWVGQSTVSGKTYYYSFKYQSRSITGPKEYSTFLRAGEQFLIRAEARLMQQNLAGAIQDLNIVRIRAGIDALGKEIATEELSRALEEERQRELFCENGQRFFDLKRTGRIDAVLSAIKPEWKSGVSSLFPIPSDELMRNPRLTQNPGYN